MNQTEKMVSVIVPVYNTPIEFLRTCVKSIVDQTYRMVELLLVDDGSQESCAEECDRLKDTYAAEIGGIRLIHKKNGGVSSARNAGLDRAKGEYIMFIDSDDYVHPDFIKILVKAIEQWNCEVAVCDSKNIYSSDEENHNFETMDLAESEIVVGSEFSKERKAMFGIRFTGRRLLIPSDLMKTFILVRTDFLSKR